MFLGKVFFLKHPKFLGRTVMVRDGNAEEAMRIVNRIMGREGLFDQWRRTRYYEKPTLFRRRLNYQMCKAIYNEDMDRKIRFILKKNRSNPFPGCT